MAKMKLEQHLWPRVVCVCVWVVFVPDLAQGDSERRKKKKKKTQPPAVSSSPQSAASKLCSALRRTCSVAVSLPPNMQLDVRQMVPSKENGPHHDPINVRFHDHWWEGRWLLFEIIISTPLPPKMISL